MRSHRFFSAIALAVGQIIALPKEASHHCLQVLRYQVDSELTLFNGDGFNYLASIKMIDGKHCEVEVTDKINPMNESNIKIHLYQGIARSEKMDLIIQKSVELGISEITPMFTQRCNVKLDAKRLSKKQQHWQNVAISASEQSGRALIVKVNRAINIKQLKVTDNSIGFYLEPTAKKRLQDNSSLTRLNLYIGPEGGFSDADIELLEHLNVCGVKLGPRILRTETAGLACSSILQSYFGDL